MANRFHQLTFGMDNIPCECCNGEITAHITGHLFDGGFRIHSVTNAKTGKEISLSEKQQAHIEAWAEDKYENTILELAPSN